MLRCWAGGGGVGPERRSIYADKRIVHVGWELYDRDGCLCSIDCGSIYALSSAGDSLFVLKVYMLSLDCSRPFKSSSLIPKFCCLTFAHQNHSNRRSSAHLTAPHCSSVIHMLNFKSRTEYIQSRVIPIPLPFQYHPHQRSIRSSFAALAASRFCLNCLYKLLISPLSNIPSTTLFANFSLFLRDQFSRSTILSGKV